MLKIPGCVGFAVAMGAGALLSGCLSRTPASVTRGLRDIAPPPIEWPQGVAPEPFTLTSGADYVRLVELPYDGPGMLTAVQMHAVPPVQVAAPIVITAPESRATLTMTLTAHSEAAGIEGEGPAFLGTYLFSAATTMQFVMSLEETKDILVTQDPSVLWVDRPESAPRGVALLLSSLTGLTPGGERLRDTLVERGWITVFSTPSLTDPSQPIFAYDDEDPAGMAAVELADRINASLAHRAYAMEAVLADLLREDSDLASLPTVAIGCSAGAIALPAMAARMPDQIDAAVLIGGGADLVDIVSNSSLLGDKLNIILNNESMTSADQETLRRKTLERATLDPYHAVLHMDHIPTLLVDARFDAIVPARTADLLYERMGRPERWRYALGHVGLFVWLSTQAASVADWIEETVDDGTRTAASR